jgi:signal transduction histidine kinase/CheY-like chemotaxis protein
VSGEDLVADRARVVEIGLAAVFTACTVFGVLRLVLEHSTGLLTPWWGNLGGAIGIAALYLYFRAAPLKRSTVAVHGTALIATVALLVPAAYGMTSSKWWLSLVGFSVLLMGRQREAIVWAIATGVLVPVVALVEPSITLEGSLGEAPAERAMAGLFFVLILLAITWAFRRAARARARQLAETAASLDRANRVRTRFLAHMSHELRTPLHGVIGMTDLAIAAASTPAVREPLQTAQESAHVLLALLNNVLDVTRADADALVMERQPFMLHAALTDALRPLSAQAQKKGLELEAHAAPGIAAARVGDRVRFSQIVMNLVGNALKFTDRGRITVTLSSADDPDRVVLAVGDTGRGIAAEKLAAIFEPFAQADSSDSRVQSGAGLGLAIVRELATRMDGRVDVESTPGGGSKFSVHLRIPRDPAGGAEGPTELLAPVLAVPPATFAEGRELDVLVCEDDAINQNVARRMLRRLGHRATLVENGTKAWAMLDSRSFDVLVTDVEMPGMDGIELTRRVRAREAAEGRSRLPIIGATAHVGEEAQHRLIEAGMDGHLPKPFTLESLSKALDRVTGS